MKKLLYYSFAALLLLAATDCRDFLDEKSNSKLTTVNNVADLQALLDNYGFLNTEYASSGETSSDDFYLTESEFNSLYFEEDKRLYKWMPNMVAKPASLGNDWMSCYRAVYICNAVLHDLDSHNFTGPDADNVRGQALALRASRYLDAAQIWCVAYDPATALSALGLPLRLDPDMSIPSTRSNLYDTYAQIIQDLAQAVKLLPDQQISKMRISKSAAYGLMARTYLIMGDYEKALSYARLALVGNDTLMDYSAISPDNEYPFLAMNSEVLHWEAMTYEYHLIPAHISRELYNSYSDNDLRKTLFFTERDNGDIFFRGYYNNMDGPNTSVTVDELYLIVAESLARIGKVEESIYSLNQLLVTRWKPGTYIPSTSDSQQAALKLILSERRKELLLRGLRWSDIKRLNRDGAGIILSRIVDGVSYELLPNDPRYAIAIPEEVIMLSGITQNPR